jgi:molybdate transport system substrate-binding protein
MHRRRFVLAVAAFLAAAKARAEVDGPVRVFAASSLKNALDEIAAAYQSETGVRLSLTYAATSVLARQIERGAPCDLMIAADQEWMDYLAAQAKIDTASRADIVGNRLVLIAPAASRAAVALAPGVDLAAILPPGARLALADAATVPAGRYAKQALQSLDAWDGVADRLAPAENVRAALAFVARGAAPLGIVYASDAVAEPAVRVLALFPAETHTPIRFPAALTRAADGRAAAFLAHLRSAAAAAVFERWGFAPAAR